MYVCGERWAPVSVSVTTTDTPAACGTYLGQDSKQSLMAVTSICEANTRTGPSGCVPVRAGWLGPCAVTAHCPSCGLSGPRESAAY